MVIQMVFPSEVLFTNVTLERLFSSVDFMVSRQTAFDSEFLSTKVTLERFFRFFSRVNTEMPIQISFMIESLFTEVTFE